MIEHDPPRLEKHFEGLINQYSNNQRPISVDFRKIISCMNSADRFTHLIHSYPAKLLMHIPFYFLSNTILSKPGDLVLDPFSGSGTVLLESILAGRNAFGADINPLARLVSKVKTKPIHTKVLKRAQKALFERIPNSPKGDIPDVVNLTYWFHSNVIVQLQCLLEAIKKTRNQDVRDYFLVNFSNCLKKVSLADPRVSVPVRLRAAQYHKGHSLHKKVDQHLKTIKNVDVKRVFRDTLETNLKRMGLLYSEVCNNPVAEVICSKAGSLSYEFSNNGKRNKSLPNESVQLIITSPPYPGAQKYIRSASFSLGWLGLCASTDIIELKKQVIGREEFGKEEYSQKITTGISSADSLLTKIYYKNKIRAAIAGAYLNEIRDVLVEQYRVLKVGGYLVIVVANNRICGEKFKTQEYLRSIAFEIGFKEVLQLIDHIRSRGLMTKRNSTASIITREYVMVFAKK